VTRVTVGALRRAGAGAAGEGDHFPVITAPDLSGSSGAQPSFQVHHFQLSHTQQTPVSFPDTLHLGLGDVILQLMAFTATQHQTQVVPFTHTSHQYKTILLKYHLIPNCDHRVSQMIYNDLDFLVYSLDYYLNDPRNNLIIIIYTTDREIFS
jgi:hypothetical protein